MIFNILLHLPVQWDASLSNLATDACLRRGRTPAIGLAEVLLILKAALPRLLVALDLPDNM